MKFLPDAFTRNIVSICRRFIFAALIFLTALNLQADAPPTTVRILNTGVDVEGLRTFRLEWDAISNATYLVQSAGSLAPGSPWHTLDAVQFRDTVGSYQIRVVATDSNGQPPTSKFYRLVLPQPEITSVEPAVVDVTVPNTLLYILGQCLPTNVLVVINGYYFTPTVVNTGGVWAVVSLNGLPPGQPWMGLTVIDAGTSNIVATLPNSVLGVDGSSPYLLEPPELPPASPETGAVFKRGYDYYKAQSNLGVTGVNTNRPRRGGGIALFDNANDSIACPAIGGGRSTGTGPNGQGLRISGNVQPFSGEVQTTEVDFAIPGRGLDFVWARTYRSRSTTNSSLGTRWTHSYDVRVQPVGSDMLIHDGTGRADRFFLQTNGTYTCPGFFREGTLTGTVFRLTFADTGYWEFNPLDGSGTAGKLRKIVDRNTNTVSVYYDNQFRCERIVDPLGRTNTISYNPAGRPASVTDFSGRTVTYQYYTGLITDPGGSLGDLKSVTSPPVTGTPNGNNFPSGKTTTYTYTTGSTTDSENHLLTTVADAEGTVIETCGYNLTSASPSYLRCISLQRWTNTPAKFSYLPQTPTPTNQFAVMRCVMNDPVGNVTELFYDARNRCVKLQEFTGRATPGVAVTDTANRPTGKVRVTDPDSYITRWSWNNDSLCTLTVAPGGQQEQCVYASDFDKSTRARKRADLRVEREIASSGVDMNGDGLTDLTERVSRFEYDSRFGSEPKANGKWKGEYVSDTPAEKSICGGFVSDTPAEKSQQAIPAPPPLGSWHGQCVGGFCTVATDPRGNGVEIGYDVTGNATNTSRGVSLNFTKIKYAMAYNPQGELTAITNAPDANNRSRVDTFSYSQGQLVQSITDAGAGGLSLTNKFERDVRGNVTRFVDARGFDRLYTYNALDQCVRAQSPVNLTARCNTDYFYDANDNLFAVSRQLRSETDALVTTPVSYLQHDPLHRVTEITLPVDATRALTNRFIYDGNDQCVLVRGGDAVSGADPFQTVAHQYDERGFVWRQVRGPFSPLQSSDQYDYDANGNLAGVSKGLEGTASITTFEYDGFAGFGSSSSSIEGHTDHAKDYIAFNDPDSFQIQGGAKPAFENMRDGMLTPRLSKITDPMGNVTTFNFDANDNLKIVRHFGQTYDVAGTNGNIRLAESRYEYDGLDRPIRSRDSFFHTATQAPIGDGERTTTFAYAPNGQCTNVTDDLGRVTSYTYDTVGWPATVTSPGSRSVFVKLRDRAGNTTLAMQSDTSDLAGPQQVFACTNVYDSLNRCISATDNVGNTGSCAFDSLGRVVKTTDPRGIRSFYTYDLLDRQTLAIRDLDGNGSPSLTLDIASSSVWSSSNGRLLATIDSHGNPTSYGYDSLSRCTSITNADGTRHTFAWNARSVLTSEQDANGTVILHTYDLSDRCISNRYTPGPTVAATTTFEAFAYDGLSRLVSASNNVSHSEMEYDSLGNNSGNHRDGWNVLSAFDSVGNRTALTYPGGRALTYTYDTLDRCAAILESSTSLAGLSYAGGRVERVNYANGMRAQFTYAGLAGVPNAPGDFSWGEVSRIRHAAVAGSPLVVEFACYRDGAGNTASASDTTPVPVLHTNTLSLGYDDANRLLNSIVTSNSALVGFATYGLDRMGNRTNINRPLCAGNYSMYDFPPALDFQMNQYTATPCDVRTYDENGNLTSVMPAPFVLTTYTYDCLNRLVAVTNTGVGVATYAYDALGRRISKTVLPTSLPPVTTQFLHDGDDVIEERVNNVVTATYVGPECIPGRCVAMRRAGQDYYFHTDSLGNTLALTTTGGVVVERYDYDDYGAVTFFTGGGVPTGATNSAVGNPYCWNGLRLDAETGLHNSDGGGYFDTQTGRVIGRVIDDWNVGDWAIYNGNNPWSGGGALYMKGDYSRGHAAEVKRGIVKIKGSSGSGGAFYMKGDFSRGHQPDIKRGKSHAKGIIKIKGGAGSMGGIAFNGDAGRGDPYPISSGHDLPCPIVDRPVLKGYFGRSVCPGGDRVWPLPGYAVKTPRTVVQSSSRVYLVRTPRTVVQSSTINARADSYDR